MNELDTQILQQIKAEVSANLEAWKPTLQGLLIEVKAQGRRNTDSRHFIVDEFRALTSAIRALTAQLEKLP